MKVTLLVTGKTDFKFIEEGNNLYISRIKHYLNFEYFTIKDLKKSKNVDVEYIKRLEGQLILSMVSANDYLVLLDENGKEIHSVEFAGFINQKLNAGVKKLVFVIGGAYGFSEDIYKRANEKISLSRLTFSHQMVRLIFLEQLYRACTIMKGEPYHK